MPSSTTASRCSRAQPQQGQRHADVVVEVALRGQRRARGMPARRIDAIICVTVVLPLLPVTAISGSVELRAPAGGQGAERQLACRRPRCPAGRRQSCRDGRSRRPRPAPAHRARKSLASKRSPLSATNRSPGCSVRVSVWTRSQPACAGSPTSRRAGNPCQRLGQRRTSLRHRHAALLASQRGLRMRLVGERDALAGDFLVVLVAFAGQQHHVFGRAPGASVSAIARARSASTCAALVVRQAQQDLADDVLGLLAARVVAGDDDPVGVFLRHGGHQRPLGRSRSPPQPNTHQSSPPRCCASGRSACQRLVQRIGRVGVVDGDQRLAAARSSAPCGRARCQAAAGAHRRCERHAERAHARRSRRAGWTTLYWPISAGCERMALLALLDHEAQPVGAVTDVAGPQAGRPLAADTVHTSSAPTPAAMAAPAPRPSRRRC